MNEITYFKKYIVSLKNHPEDLKLAPIWIQDQPEEGPDSTRIAPRASQMSERSLRPSILTSFRQLVRTFLGLTAQMSPRPAPRAKKTSKMNRKTTPRESETNPEWQQHPSNFGGVRIQFALCSTLLSDPLRYDMIKATDQQVNIYIYIYIYPVALGAMSRLDPHFHPSSLNPLSQSPIGGGCATKLC